jgi:anti-sigma factor ChrR (cupin superfamily)
MKNGPPDLYADYVLDTLSEPERAKVTAEIGASPESAHDLTLTRQALALWAEDRVTDETPSPDLRRRLLQTVAGGAQFARFAPVVALLRRLFDLPAEVAADLLAKADGLTDWLEAAPGVRYFHFAPGAAVGQLEAGIVRIRPGATFPRHRHRGPEVTLVLDGTLLDRGQVYGAGRVVESATGSEHDYSAGGGRDLILASLHSGIDFV